MIRVLQKRLEIPIELLVTRNLTKNPLQPTAFVEMNPLVEKRGACVTYFAQIRSMESFPIHILHQETSGENPTGSPSF